ncbi:hypothetical protein LRR74_28700, partial [Klebsiella pneumoniae]|nr:hypothetical protein [Klebsiella pneumoniae]
LSNSLIFVRSNLRVFFGEIFVIILVRMAKPAANIKELNVRFDKLSEEFKDEFLKSQSTAITITNMDVSPLDLLKTFENRINDAINEIKVDINSLKNNINTVKKRQQNSEMKNNVNFLLVQGGQISEVSDYISGSTHRRDLR